MSLADVITRFSTAAADGTPAGYIVTRTPQGTYGTDGVYVAGGAPSQITIDACVQPHSGIGFKAGTDGRRVSSVVTVDTATLLQVESPTTEPDVITIRGEPYRVLRVDGPQTLNGVSTYRAYAARQAIP